MFRSDDGGSNWTDRTAGLPNLPINAVQIDPANANRVWVAADLGVYQSTDGGATWADFSNGLPNMFVGDLVFHPHARVLRAGTRNRGVWEIPVDGWMTQPLCGVQWTGTLAGNADAALVHLQLAGDLARRVDRHADDAAARFAAGTLVRRRSSAPSAEYVTYWITVTQPHPRPAGLRGSLLHPEPLLERRRATCGRAYSGRGR